MVGLLGGELPPCLCEEPRCYIVWNRGSDSEVALEATKNVIGALRSFVGYACDAVGTS